MTGRRIYESSNGDAWTLLKQGDELIVRHQANLASGGNIADLELGTFLSQERHSPQRAALLQMIGTLVVDEQ